MMTNDEPSVPRNVGLLEIFLLFSQLGLSSFGGGVSAWMHRSFVERRGWFSETEFAAALALARIMPGANVINLAVVIGQRSRGAAGAAAAALGLIVGPSLGVIALAIVYRQLAGTQVAHSALAGAAASAVGLLIGMVFHSARALLRPAHAAAQRAASSVAAVAVAAAIFICIAVLRWPTVPTVLCLAPVSMALVFLARGKGAERSHGGG
jgi:chromate transporter